MSKPYAYIGIDPGATTGFALWLPNEKLLKLHSLDFWDTVYELNNHFTLYEQRLLVVIEAAWKINKSYQRHEGESGYRGMLKINRNAGAANREGELLSLYVKRNEMRVLEIIPNARKMGAGQFRQLTGYTKRTNQHERDAAMLVWGRP
ncbi:MAG TPA: hypothetical protein PK916_09030 [Bacteroidota bacterium]|nr:hypothetical protein [Bacteroidota bacterium]